MVVAMLLYCVGFQQREYISSVAQLLLELWVQQRGYTSAVAQRETLVLFQQGGYTPPVAQRYTLVLLVLVGERLVWDKSHYFVHLALFFGFGHVFIDKLF